MPFATIGAARDAIMAHFETEWTAAYAPAAAPLVAWQDLKNRTPLDDEAWVRIKMVHKTGFQATINSPGNRRFRARGTIHVECRAPLGDGLTGLDTLVNNVQAIFEGRTVGGMDGVIFRNVTPGEQGPDGAWNLVDVAVNFEYDRLR